MKTTTTTTTTTTQTSIVLAYNKTLLDYDAFCGPNIQNAVKSFTRVGFNYMQCHGREINKTISKQGLVRNRDR